MGLDRFATALNAGGDFYYIGTILGCGCLADEDKTKFMILF